MPTALVIGAGIGGLATAIALAQDGWQVIVAEQAVALTEVGAGIQISPNGVKALAQLGVELQQSFRPEAVEMRLGTSGQRIFGIELGDYAPERWGVPYFHVHRADLLEALMRRAHAFEAIEFRLGLRLAHYTQNDKATAHFEDGTELAADLLIGADGLHSVVRRQMHGAGRARFTGSVAWRLLVPSTALKNPPPKTACAWAGDHKHAVTYYLRGGDLVNFVGIVEEKEAGPESWSGEGRIEQVRAQFEGWSDVVSGILDAASNARRWALYDRAPLTFWSKGPVVLLGDAAHPMLPSMAQGACMALEDAVVLAKTLKNGGALEDFFSARIIRVTRVQKEAEANLKLFHQAGPISKTVKYAPFWLGSRVLPREAHRRLDWLYGFEV